MPTGLLAPGLHSAIVAELQQAFVAPFDPAGPRQRLFRGYLAHRTAIGALIPILNQWVDGSFVSSHAAPADIDVVTFMDGETYDRLSPAVQRIINTLIPGKHTVPAFGCDSYGVFVYAPGHRDYTRYASARLFWTNQWAKDRDGRPKGFIEVT